MHKDDDDDGFQITSLREKNDERKKKKVKILTPVKDHLSYFDPIESLIKKKLKELLYEPLLRKFRLKKKRILNSQDDVRDAIEKGLLTYSNGRFKGKFSSKTAKTIKELGGVWEKSSKSYVISSSSIPKALKEVIKKSSLRFEINARRAKDFLSKEGLTAKISGSIKLTPFFETLVVKATSDINQSLAGLALPAKISVEQKKIIAKDWGENLDLYIRKFTDDEIIKLRKTVEKSTFSGNRYETLLKGIQKSYGVTSRKARFLARQETNLLLAKFKETRYTDANVNEYIWTNVKMPKDTSPNQHTVGNVRYSHAILDGKVFRWIHHL